MFEQGELWEAEACDKIDFRNRLGPFCRISELQFAGGQRGSCCGRTSYLPVQWEVTCVDKKEGFIVSGPIPSALETATVVHEEAQVASCSQQRMWKRPKGLFCCVCWAACPAEAGGSSELLYPLRSVWDPGSPWGSHVPASIRGGSGVNLPAALNSWLSHTSPENTSRLAVSLGFPLMSRMRHALQPHSVKFPAVE